jgi:hypothetical protein
MKKRSTKEILLTPNPDNTLEQKRGISRSSSSSRRRRRAWEKKWKKLKIIEKTYHHHHHHFLLLLLLHYHLLHVETIGCRLNNLLPKTEEVCSKLWFARKVESLSL